MSLAGVAHPVERHLAKVEVASSSLVTRSIIKKDHTNVWSFFIMELGGNKLEPSKYMDKKQPEQFNAPAEIILPVQK